MLRNRFKDSNGKTQRIRSGLPRGHGADRQIADLLATDVRRDDLYLDNGVSRAGASRPALDRAPDALHSIDILVIMPLGCLGRFSTNILTLGGGEVDTVTPLGSMLFTLTAALAQMELEIKRERITDSVAKRRASGRDLGMSRATL